MMKQKNRRRSKSVTNFISLALSQIVTIAFGLLLPRLYIVEYGSAVNGLLSSVSQMLVYLGLFEAGVATVSLQALYKPVADDDWDSVNGVLSATRNYYNRAARWYFIVLTALALLYPLAVDTGLNYGVAAGVVFLSGAGSVLNFALQGKYIVLLRADGRNYVSARLTILVSVLTNVSKIVLISMGFSVLAVLIATFAVQAVQAGFYLWYIRRAYKKLNLSVPPDNAAIGQRGYSMVHQVATLIFRNTDMLVLTVFCGLNTVSVYSLYKMVVSHLESVLNTVLSSVNHRLGQTFHTDRKRFLTYIDCFESCYSALGFALFAVAYFFLLPFLKLYTRGIEDVNYIDQWLPVLFIAIELLIVMRTPMLRVINYAGHFKLTTPQTIAESIVNVVTSLAGVYFLGIHGVLLGTVAALLYRTNDIIFYSNRRILERSPLKTYAIHGVNAAVFFLLQWLFGILVPEITGYGLFVVYGAIATVVALCAFAAAQLLCFPHCRALVRTILKRLKHA